LNLKTKFDFRSIRFKLWIYFIGFALLLISLIWFLQIYFLNNYYKEMKTAETTKLADQLITAYKTDDQDAEQFLETLSEMIEANDDVYIRVQVGSHTLYSPEYEGHSAPAANSVGKAIGTQQPQPRIPGIQRK